MSPFQSPIDSSLPVMPMLQFLAPENFVLDELAKLPPSLVFELPQRIYFALAPKLTNSLASLVEMMDVRCCGFPAGEDRLSGKSREYICMPRFYLL